MITENTAKFGGGAYMQKRYIDLIDRTPKDERTGDEIARDVIRKMGLEG